MAEKPKRDNRYWEGRLQKDGHQDILRRYQASEVSMYKARQLAGYLREKPTTPAGRLSYHWGRASHIERKHFVLQHAKAINKVLLEIRDDHRELKAKKNTG